MGEEKKLDELFELVKGINSKVQSMDSKIQSMDSKIQSMDSKIQSMDSKIQSMDDKIQSMDDKIQSMCQDIKGIHETLERHDNDIRDLRLTLENVTNRNISIIAENHLELNRKLNEALKRKEEEEKLYMRMNIAENDIRRLKEKAGIA